MKKLILLATLAACLAMPAAVSARPTPIRNNAVHDSIALLEADINRADNNDTISEREAANLRDQLRGLRADYQRMNNNGLTAGETRSLENRIANIRSRLRSERRDVDRHRG